MVTLSVIIVNYNVRDFLEQSLLSVQKALKDVSHEIIVVDNASGDGSVRMIQDKFPGVILIKNSVNTGFAKANNKAIRRSEGKFIALLNPDTLVKEDTFSAIIKAFDEYPDTGMIGCKVLNPDGTLQLSCRRSFPTPWVALTRLLGLSFIFRKSRLFARYNMTYLDPDQPAEVDAISGSFMTVRREVIETAGYLDEQYFMYGEDLDWCFRIKKFGWGILYYPKTSIIHYKGESSRSNDWNQLKLFYDAMVIFSEKNLKSYNNFTPLWMLKTAIWLRALITVLGRMARELTVPLIDAFFINASILLAFYLRFDEIVLLPFFGDYRDYLLLGGASTVIILTSLFINGVYPGQKFGIRRSMTGAFWGAVIASLFVFFSRQLAVSRIVIILSAAFQVVSLSGWRFILKFISRNILGGVSLRISRELLPTRSIIIGSDAVSREIYLRFMRHQEYSRQLVGLVSTGASSLPDKKQDIPVLGDLQEIRTIIKKHNITDIIFAAASHSYERIIGTITLCQDERVNFKLVPSSLGLIIGKSSVVPLGDVPLVDIEYKYFESKNRFLKRLLDLSFAGFLVITVLPAYLEEKWRKGLKNRSIYILSEKGAPLYIKQVEKDGRKYKGWARFYPLWIHVLKGEISFIGAPLFAEKRTSVRRISLLKPGIFSFESGEKGKTAELNRRTFELTYLKNYTILYDLRILVQRVLRRE